MNFLKIFMLRSTLLYLLLLAILAFSASTDPNDKLTIFDQIFTLRFLLTGVEEKTRFFEKNHFSERFLMLIRVFFAPPPHLPLKKRWILIQFFTLRAFYWPEWKKRNHRVWGSGGVPKGLPAVPGIAVWPIEFWSNFHIARFTDRSRKKTIHFSWKTV